jgi:hypothetical protein
MCPRMFLKEVCTRTETKTKTETKKEACTNAERRRSRTASSAPDDRSPRGRTFHPRTFAAVTRFALAAALPFGAVAQKPSAAGATADLPSGTMQGKASSACLECHEARIILQQRLSKPAWAKEVDKMTKWGAVVDPSDRDALIDYLSTNFSPEKPAYEPPRTAADKSSSGKTK